MTNNTIKYKNGDMIGRLLLVQRLGRKVKGAQMAEFKCHCGKYFVAMLKNVVIGYTKSCGCSSSYRPAKYGAIIY